MNKSLDTIFQYPLKDWIIWVGAGISIPNPTALPSGWSLTRFTLQTATCKEIQNKIFDVWQQANQIVSIPENDTPLGVIPRLESILGEVENIQNNTKSCEFDFLRGFKSFIDAPYNENHLHIAYLLHAGATVITTNFDTCIQDAYSDLMKNSDQLIPQKEGNTCYYVSYKCSDTGLLWHIHGVANEILGLGATIRIVKEGLNSKFQEFLDSRLNKSSVLIFLGYSASDSFDVNLYFTNKKQKEFDKSLSVFIQHGNSKIQANVHRIVKCFGNVVLENADTSIFLKNLSHQEFHGIPHAENFIWDHSFVQNANLINRSKLKVSG